MNVKYRSLLCFLIFLFISNISDTTATAPQPTRAVPEYEFTQVYPPVKSPIIGVIEDYHATAPTRPKVNIPSSPVISVPIKTTPTSTNVKRNFTSGKATYYCLTGISRCTVGHSGGMYAAIRHDLLYLRGKTIQVCNFGTNHCIFVKIIDCNCGPGANLIDLYSDAFKKLAPLSRGFVKVVIKL